MAQERSQHPMLLATARQVKQTADDASCYDTFACSFHGGRGDAADHSVTTRLLSANPQWFLRTTLTLNVTRKDLDMTRKHLSCVFMLCELELARASRHS